MWNLELEAYTLLESPVKGLSPEGKAHTVQRDREGKVRGTP